MIRIAQIKDKKRFSESAKHVMQSWEWGEFREKTGNKILRIIEENDKNWNVFSLTVHSVPKTKFNIGYMPKSIWPSEQVLVFLEGLARKENIVFIKIEPDVEIEKFKLKKSKIKIIKSQKDIFAKSTFLVDLTKPEEDLFRSLNQKTRYNVRVAQKNNVVVEVSDKVDDFVKLQRETAKRNGFYLHPDSYYKTVFELFAEKKMAKIISAKYKGKILTSWMLFIFKDVWYYPYGGSSSEQRNLMHSNLVAWEAIKLAKREGGKVFDMWGALGKNPNEKDPWYGFHRFKSGYGGELVEYPGAYDLVVNQKMYLLMNMVDKARWIFLRLKKRVAA